MPARTHGGPSSRTARFGWMISIWTGSVLALGAVAIAFRFLMNLAGLTTG